MMKPLLQIKPHYFDDSNRWPRRARTGDGTRCLCEPKLPSHNVTRLPQILPIRCDSPVNPIPAGPQLLLLHAGLSKSHIRRWRWRKCTSVCITCKLHVSLSHLSYAGVSSATLNLYCKMLGSYSCSFKFSQGSQASGISIVHLLGQQELRSIVMVTRKQSGCRYIPLAFFLQQRT